METDRPTRAGTHAPAGSLTHDVIRDIVGDIEDAKAAAIIATGATAEDLEEAVAWASGESDMMGDMERPLAGVIAQVYDILTAEEELEEERE